MKVSEVKKHEFCNWGTKVAFYIYHDIFLRKIWWIWMKSMQEFFILFLKFFVRVNIYAQLCVACVCVCVYFHLDNYSSPSMQEFLLCFYQEWKEYSDQFLRMYKTQIFPILTKTSLS